MTTLEPGQRVRARVRKIADLVVYVDLVAPADSALREGTIHAIDLSWTPIADAADHVHVGDELELVVLRVAGPLLVLGRKQLTEDPYPSANHWFPVESTTSGRIVRIRATGADVQIAPGVIGSLHASELPAGAKEGDELDVVVLRWATERHLYLGAAVESAPPAASPTPPVADAYRAFAASADASRFRSPYIPLEIGKPPIAASNERIIASLAASERRKVHWLLDCIEHASRILDLDLDRATVHDFIALGRSLIDGEYHPSAGVRAELDELQAALDRAVARAQASDVEAHKCCANILYVLLVIDGYLFRALAWFEQEHAGNPGEPQSWFAMAMGKSGFLPLWHVLDGCAASAGGAVERAWQADALAATRPV